MTIAGNRGTALAALSLALALVLAFGVTCDWFEEQLESNLPPETSIVRGCDEGGGFVAGENLTFVWTGTDVDGTVPLFQWSLDKVGWVETTADSTVIEAISVGSHIFSVRAVDNKGEADPDPAECTFMVGQLVPRMVLAEFLTTNTCQKCPTADAALESLQVDLGREALAVVAYHDLTARDKLATDETVARIDYYTSFPDIPGDQWPIVIFDGLRTVEGSVGIEESRTEYGFEISQRQAVGSRISLGITGDLSPAGGDIDITAKVKAQLPSGALVLRTVVIENDVRYDGYFADIFGFVARDILDDEDLSSGASILAEIGDSVQVHRTFPVAEGWTLDNVDVIAFIQNIDTREVLQAARLKID